MKVTVGWLQRWICEPCGVGEKGLNVWRAAVVLGRDTKIWELLRSKKNNLFCVVIRYRLFLSQEISVEYVGPCGYGGGQLSISHPDRWSFQAGNNA